MSADSYFVKIRGRVIGPFPPERLVQMVRQGNLSRIHQLSSDGKSWQPATEFPQFFQAAAAVSAGSNHQAAAPIASPATTNADTATRHPQALPVQEADNHDQWYYGINDQSTGPVTKSTIKELLSSGQLSQTDMLWRSGMNDWEPVSNFSSFGGIGNQNQRANKPSDHFAYDSSMRVNQSEKSISGTSVFADMLSISQLMRASNPWVYFCFIFLYVVAVLATFGSIFGLIKGIQIGNFYMITQSLMGLFQTGLLVTAAVFLNHHAISASRFVLSNSSDDLYQAIKALGRFWLWLGILLMLSITLLVIAILYAYTVVGAFTS